MVARLRKKTRVAANQRIGDQLMSMHRVTTLRKMPAHVILPGSRYYRSGEGENPGKLRRGKIWLRGVHGDIEGRGRGDCYYTDARGTIVLVSN